MLWYICTKVPTPLVYLPVKVQCYIHMHGSQLISTHKSCTQPVFLTSILSGVAVLLTHYLAYCETPAPHKPCLPVAPSPGPPSAFQGCTWKTRHFSHVCKEEIGESGDEAIPYNVLHLTRWLGHRHMWLCVSTYSLVPRLHGQPAFSCYMCNNKSWVEPGNKASQFRSCGMYYHHTKSLLYCNAVLPTSFDKKSLESAGKCMGSGIDGRNISTWPWAYYYSN